MSTEALRVAVEALEDIAARKFGTLMDLARQAIAAEDALARIAEIEATALPDVSQKSASNDAAIWDEYPRPWRVEEDWTAEVLAANGKLVTKIMYPRDLWLARLIVRLVNATTEAAAPPDDEALVERVARAIYDALPFGVWTWEDAPASTREDCLVCARAAIAASPPQDGWRPIESAPRDGNEVLLLHRYHRHGNSQIVAFWDDEGNKTARWQTVDGPAYHEEWPSHWRHLPPPPASEPTPEGT